MADIHGIGPRPLAPATDTAAAPKTAHSATGLTGTAVPAVSVGPKSPGDDALTALLGPVPPPEGEGAPSPKLPLNPKGPASAPPDAESGQLIMVVDGLDAPPETAGHAPRAQPGTEPDLFQASQLLDPGTRLRGEAPEVVPAGLPTLPVDVAGLQSLPEIPVRFAQALAALKLPLPGLAQNQPADPAVVKAVMELFKEYGDRFVALTRAKVSLPPGLESVTHREEAARTLGRAAASFVQTAERALPGKSDLRSASVEQFVQALKTLGFKDVREALSHPQPPAESLAESRPTPQRSNPSAAAARAQTAEGAAQKSQSLPAERVAADVARTAAQAQVAAREGGKGSGLSGVLPDAHAVIATAPAMRDGDMTREPPTFAERLKRSTGQLSPKLFWNALHTFRGIGEDSVLQKDQWNRLMLVAILILAGILAVVVILINL